MPAIKDPFPKAYKFPFNTTAENPKQTKQSIQEEWRLGHFSRFVGIFFFDLKLFLIKPLIIKYFPPPLSPSKGGMQKFHTFSKYGAVRYQIWVAMDEVHCEKEEDKICFWRVFLHQKS